MSLKEVYKGLPSEALSVANRIGLKHSNKDSGDKSFVNKFVSQKIIDEELRYTTYLLKDIPNKFNRKKKKNKKTIGLNAKQRKKLFSLKSNDVKYETFERINDLWHKYIDSVINEIKCKSDEIKLIRADFHGAYVYVSAAANPTLVGVKGFVVYETKNTFKIVNKDNRLLTIPKNGTLFAFEHNQQIIKFNGNNIRMSSHHRSKIKPKLKLYEKFVDF
ncbi:ribonuclease P protein subunit p29-like [Oppia nitens]|uniref:ribonuclease P protein subunit p29-like n=1 Tax=Oppia nitens TaxID=1686743 RepID=UPI0023DA5888|nr:ribonuclease P protein subunit p29-like [Oppia nitens]